MFWKRIEIVSCTLAAGMALYAGVSMAGSSAQEVRGARTHPARAFPVFLESSAVARQLPPLPGVHESSAGASATGATDQDVVPDIPYSYFWEPQDGLRMRSYHYARQEISDHSPGLLGGFEQPWVETPETRWQPRPSGGGWSADAANWNARLDDSTEFALGTSEVETLGWNESIRLSGVSLSQSFMASSDDVSQWNYSLAFGAVDQSSSGASDLTFGPTAGSLALSYDYSPRLSLATQTEVAADLIMSGVTGQYDLGPLGRWRSGIARSNHGMHQGWRYRAMADFDLADDLSLAWEGERHTDGFMDIRRYAAGSNPVGGGRQRWSASWDVGRWGEWSGSFETVHGSQGTQQRRFGLSQEFWYSPNLRIGIHAEREAVADDYDIGLRFSFPLY